MKQSLTAIFLIIAVLLSGSLAVSSPVSALSGSEFKAGRIIDDMVFYNGTSMDVDQIQSFLDSKVQSCDTWGQQPFGNTTRAVYGASIGNPPPYTCLRDLRQDTGYKAGESGLCSAIEAKSSRTAAQIIDDVARACHISQKAILVMLQKEQGLITDDWPWSIQYRSAMGYGCPDTAPCDVEYYGFFNQVYSAALQFQRYKADPPNWNHIPFMTNQVRYQANASSCGSRSVYIENYATAGLYNYTPYTPNQAALDNIYGMGDSCSAYGNRNFWRYYNDWFGSTFNYVPASCDAKRPGISCVWHLNRGGTDANFLTISTQERDIAVNAGGYAYTDYPFYAYSSQAPGTIPVYRLRLINEHFYTTSLVERDTLLQNTQNTYEGIAFYALPANTSTNAAYPVYRLAGKDHSHKFVASASDRDLLIAEGYIFEGVSFNAPSGFIEAENPSSGRINVYRVNKGSKHFYTISLSEADSLLRTGWSYEGLLLQAPSNPTAIPLYRLRSSQSNSHLFTSSADERDSLQRNGWALEGIAWYIDASVPQTYRFYINGSHFYTSDINEAIDLVRNGGNYESIGYGYRQESTLPTFRIFNGTDHLFTVDSNEMLLLVKRGWRYEGISWYTETPQSGQPVFRLMNGTRHFYTSSAEERDLLIASGWIDEGVGWHASASSTNKVVYRLLNGSRHFYTLDEGERTLLVSQGWKLEGVAWYGPAN